MKRKIEITAIEQIRIRGTRGQKFCPVCQKFTEYLTSAQAAKTARVKTEPFGAGSPNMPVQVRENYDSLSIIKGCRFLRKLRLCDGIKSRIRRVI